MGGLRATKKQQTRELIIECALDLFEAKGFEATTIDEIAAAANVSARSVFRYFTSKEDIAFLGQDAENRQVHEIATRAPKSADPIELLMRGTREILVTSVGNAEQAVRSMRIIQSTPALRGHQARLFHDVQETIARALIPPRTPKREALRLRLLAAMHVAALEVTMRDWLAGGARGDLDERLREVEELLAHGFRGRPR